MVKRSEGFSIVELIVVIVIIAILMTIAIVSYGWMTEDARDAARRQRAAEIAKAIQLLITKKNVQQIGGIANGGTTPQPIANSGGLCGYEGGYHGGWLYNPPGPSGAGYPCDMGQMLVANGIVPKELLSTGPENDEFTASTNRITASLMLFRCTQNPKTLVLYYHVKNPTPEETRDFNRLIDPGVCGRNGYMPSKAILGDRYKMKAAIEIKT